MYCMYCGMELPEYAKFCAYCGGKLEEMATVAEQKVVSSEAVKYEEDVKADDKRVVYETEISLAEFRKNAPNAVGFRDTLIAYRKSLENSWDYNAYVGILLGVGGPKHGDAACMNYAIGQGDNTNGTRKQLNEKGLMYVFEKYRGKKMDPSIMLSDVEDEIIAIAPEYRQIRDKLHEVAF